MFCFSAMYPSVLLPPGVHLAPTYKPCLERTAPMPHFGVIRVCMGKYSKIYSYLVVYFHLLNLLFSMRGASSSFISYHLRCSWLDLMRIISLTHSTQQNQSHPLPAPLCLKHLLLTRGQGGEPKLSLRQVLKCHCTAHHRRCPFPAGLMRTTLKEYLSGV